MNRPVSAWAWRNSRSTVTVARVVAMAGRVTLLGLRVVAGVGLERITLEREYANRFPERTKADELRTRRGSRMRAGQQTGR
jgi:hypothetical protein